MTAAAKLTGTKIVTVHRERGRSGVYFASSDDIDGLVLSAPSPEKLAEMIPNAITQLYAACGVSVIVTIVDGGKHDDTDQYAALPAEVAQKKLSELAAA